MVRLNPEKRDLGRGRGLKGFGHDEQEAFRQEEKRRLESSTSWDPRVRWSARGPRNFRSLWSSREKGAWRQKSGGVRSWWCTVGGMAVVVTCR